MLLALLSLSHADDGAIDFLTSLDAPPAFVMTCPRAAQGLELLSATPFAEHLDAAAPFHVAMMPGPGGVAIVLSSGLIDAEGWLESERHRLDAEGWIHREGRWEDSGGNLVAQTTLGDRGEVRAWTPTSADSPLEALGSVGLSDLERAEGLGETCVFAGGLRTPTAGEIVLLLTPRGGEVVSGLVYGSAFDAADRTLVDRSPPEAPSLRSTTEPDLYARLNVDIHDLVGTWADGQGLQASLGAMVEELEDSGLRFQPGAEGALWADTESIDFLLVAPLLRPRKASRVLKRMEREGKGTLGADGVLVVQADDGTPLFVGAKGRHLAAATNPARVLGWLEGQGTLWGEGTSAEDPGVSVFVNSEAIRAALFAAGRSELAGDSLPSFDLHLRDEGEALRFTISAPGYQHWVAAMVAQRAPKSDDPIGHPPSTEALSVLMSIADAEQKAYDERGHYLPYRGGPRGVAELDSEVVEWEGIPELGIGSMQTACRYAVELSLEGYTARSVCDEDGDGKHAVTVMTLGGLPHRVTPAEVR
ncbi:MAG TPA: hypothetical protein QGF58_15600 [Myxococcota bacterium]|nr:hypothetical protein [Myxococcota bacterium]